MIWPVSCCKTGHIALQNGLYCTPKLAVSHSETGLLVPIYGIFGRQNGLFCGGKAAGSDCKTCTLVFSRVLCQDTQRVTYAHAKLANLRQNGRRFRISAYSEGFCNIKSEYRGRLRFSLTIVCGCSEMTYRIHGVAPQGQQAHSPGQSEAAPRVTRAWTIALQGQKH